MMNLIIFLGSSHCQEFSGKVLEYDEHGHLAPIQGAMLQWKNTAIGGITDANGKFNFQKTVNTDTLIVIYQAYQNDTIKVPLTQYEMDIILSSAHALDAVNVTAHSGAYISVKPILTNVISGEGLRKAACCNLAESFESTAAVDVEYSDAVSGAKQISMLGLAGVYSQILLENVPYIRLLANQFGLGFIPGTWMEAISISKGVASVTNGYEAISGQIDVEYKKPETNNEKLFLNLFGNSMGKGEINLNSRIPVGKKENASTMFLLHTEGQLAKVDMNKDHFLDVPRNGQVNFMNRWDYDVPGKLEGRTMINYLWEDRIGGETNFNPKNDRSTDSIYGLRIKTHKLDFITKNGFLLKGEHESIGTILSFTFHDNNSYFGFRDYTARQLSGYANILYSNKFGAHHQHKLTAGGSFQFDHLNEKLSQFPSTTTFKDARSQAVPGLFAEYSYTIEDKLTIMPGMRIDYDFYYKKLYWTPRLHLKWQAAKNSSFRLSAGKGYRTANVLIENLSLLVSNRAFVNADQQLRPEEAYNAGISFVQNFNMKGGKSTFSVDYYYTHFTNQVIIDLDRDAHAIYVYNLNGDFNGKHNLSYSHSVQAEFTLYPIERFEIILAYRYNNVQLTTDGQLQQKTLMSPHKAVLGLSYATKFNKWKFNTTLQYNSSMRIPDMEGNSAAKVLPTHSPDYFIWNAQITKKFKKWEIYIGGENLLNYKQKNPILSADNPFDNDFDASIIYAPITGIMGYLGIRYTLK